MPAAPDLLETNPVGSAHPTLTTTTGDPRQTPDDNKSRMCKPAPLLCSDAIEGRTRKPAAMAAGVTDTLWSFEQLFDRVMDGGYAIAA